MILLVDKPAWRTSHDVVKFIKIHGWYKKVGHAGTLDPSATGLLLILTDDDTKRMAELVWHDKRYTATIDLAHISDTRDADYHELYEEIKISEPPTQEQISQVLQSFVPKSLLPIPSFSAKKMNGKRMYETARAWVIHDQQKEMEIYEIELLECSFPFVKIRCHVGSWTFIRSIAYTLWKKLGTWGVICALRRESSGDFSVADPTCIHNIEEHFKNW